MPKDIDIAVVSTQELQRLREVEAASAAPEGERSALRRIGDVIRYSPALLPWMRVYAEWLTLDCAMPPKLSGRTAKIRGLAHAPISYGQIKTLEARPDFIAYVRDLQAGSLERARKRFESAYPEYVDAHRDALNLARDANDYAAMARIAEPVLDRVAPKKNDGASTAAITVVLTPGQLQGFTAYAPAELECEVVEAVVDDAP